MKVVFSLLAGLLMFGGCSMIQPRVHVPKMDKIEPANLSWIDDEYKGKRVHILSEHEWQTIQVELINRRLTANACISILNNVAEIK